MSYQRNISVSILLLLVVIAVLFFTTTFTWWGTVLFLFSLVTLVLLSIFFFISKTIFYTWGKFAIIYLPFALIWILATPTTAGFLQADREIVTWWTAGGFLVISLLIIAWKSWRLRRSGGQK